jgi:mono/diheme cytochrome c family protein
MNEKKKNPAAPRGGTVPVAGPARADDIEPSAGKAAVPVWLILLFALLFFWGQVYLDHHGGGFSAQVYEPFNRFEDVDALRPKGGLEAKLALGKARYEALCAPCHQSSGLGTPGQFPPLVASEWVLTAGPGRMTRIALHGLTGPIMVKGQPFNGAMPPMGEPRMGGTLTEEELAAVLTYVRQSWGNNASEVTIDQVKAVRAATADRNSPWTADELTKVSEGE